MPLGHRTETETSESNLPRPKRAFIIGVVGFDGWLGVVDTTILPMPERVNCDGLQPPCHAEEAADESSGAGPGTRMSWRRDPSSPDPSHPLTVTLG